MKVISPGLSTKAPEGCYAGLTLPIAEQRDPRTAILVEKVWWAVKLFENADVVRNLR